MDRAPAAKAPQTVQVLDRSLNLIDFIASRRHPIALHEIARDALLPPSTVHRLLRNLENHGYVERDQNNYWRLGFKFLEFGHLVRDRLPVREKALPLMHVLFEKTGATVNLSMRCGDSIIYIEHVFDPQIGVRLSRQIGAKAPLHCTSCGKLFLSELPTEELTAYIARTHLQARTEHSIRTPEQLIVALEHARELGWADDIEELEPGIQCIGAPIRNGLGKMVAAISIICASDIRRKPEWPQHLLQATAAVSASMGWLGARN